MKLCDAMRDYLAFITHERGLAKTTVTGYTMYLRHLLRWMEENGYPDPDIADWTTPLLRRFLYHLSGLGRRPRTIRGAFFPIRGLGEFLVTNGALKDNPAKALTMPKKDAAKRLLVTDDEVCALLEACERQRLPRDVALSRAMLSVMVFAGLRRQELIDLHVTDVNFTEGSILVRSGKGSKSRTVYPHQDCLTAIREWLTFRPKDCAHTYLWSRDKSRRITDDGIRAMLGTIKAIAGMHDHDNICPHSLRHNAATRLLRNGANIRDIQAFLGHAQLQTTAIYLHTGEEQLRNIAELTALKPTHKEPADDGKILRLPHRQEQEQRRSRRIAR